MSDQACKKTATTEAELCEEYELLARAMAPLQDEADKLEQELRDLEQQAHEKGLRLLRINTEIQDIYALITPAQCEAYERRTAAEQHGADH